MRTDNPYHITKYSRKDDARKLTASMYMIKNTQTKAVAVYLSEHKPHSDGATDADKMSNDRRKRYPRSGLSSVVKKLTLVSALGEWPKALSMKCFLESDAYSSADLTNKIDEIAPTYEAWYGFAQHFSRKDKNYLLTPWLGDKNLLELLNSPESHPAPTTIQLITAFCKLLKKVSEFHQLHGRGIGDIKPANLMPAFDENNTLCDINPIDIIGSIDGRCFPYSEPYVSIKDLQKIAANGNKGIAYTPQSDFRSLAIVLSLLAHHHSKSNTVSYEDAEFTFSKDSTSVTPSYTAYIPRAGKVESTDHADSHAELILQWMVNCLASGKNPLHPAYARKLTQYQLLSDLEQLANAIEKVDQHHEKQRRLIQSLAKTNSWYYGRAITELKQKMRIAKECSAIHNDISCRMASTDPAKLHADLLKLHKKICVLLPELSKIGLLSVTDSIATIGTSGVTECKSLTIKGG